MVVGLLFVVSVVLELELFSFCNSVFQKTSHPPYNVWFTFVTSTYAQFIVFL